MPRIPKAGSAAGKEITCSSFFSRIIIKRYCCKSSKSFEKNDALSRFFAFLFFRPRDGDEFFCQIAKAEYKNTFILRAYSNILFIFASKNRKT
jgi:hypothetical protein